MVSFKARVYPHNVKFKETGKIVIYQYGRITHNALTPLIGKIVKVTVEEVKE